MIYEKCIRSKVGLIPNKTAIVWNDRNITYSEIDIHVEMACSKMKEFGVKRQDRVLIISKNCDEMVYVIFACLKVGAIFVPVSPEETEDRLKYIIEDCDPICIYINSDRVKTLLQMNTLTLRKAKDTWNHYPAKEDEEYGCIIYTSGSTGNPLGVLEPLKSMEFCIERINEVVKNCASDIVMLGIPISFDYGLYQLFLVLSVGATLVILESYSMIATIPSIIQKYSVTGLPVVPSILSLLLKAKRISEHKMKTLRYITSTGDVLTVENIVRLMDLLPNVEIIPMYGLTECKRVAIMPSGMRHKVLQGSCGFPMRGVVVCVRDDKGCNVPVGEIGELIVSGPNLMSGYWNNVKKTEEKYKKMLDGVELHTGDYFTIDCDGYLYYVGRKGDFIKRLGQRISPKAIEEVIAGAIGVIDVAVIGIKDEIQGEVIYAYISGNDMLDKNSVRQKCNTLPKAMRPEKCIFF